jgi:hypothetical protein
MPIVGASPIAIEWNSELSIFSSEPFLKAVGDEYGWLGGFDQSGALQCILPYTIVRSFGLRMARFRVETLPVNGKLGIDEETDFLNKAVVYLRTIGADVVIPATTNSVFRTYPSGADAAPYGSYVVDLRNSEEALWRALSTNNHRNIKKAEKSGVEIRSGEKYLRQAYLLIRDTLQRSRMQFMKYESLERFLSGLGNHGMVLVAEMGEIVQSCAIYAFSDYCAYYVYGGNKSDTRIGAGNLIHWEAMRMFRNLGVKRYDFVGARIDPPSGSKQESLNLFKRSFGGELKRGYLWKYSLRPLRAAVYSIGVKLSRGGDIVDNERHKMAVDREERK